MNFLSSSRERRGLSGRFPINTRSLQVCRKIHRILKTQHPCKFLGISRWFPNSHNTPSLKAIKCHMSLWEPHTSQTWLSKEGIAVCHFPWDLNPAETHSCMFCFLVFLACKFWKQLARFRTVKGYSLLALMPKKWLLDGVSFASAVQTLH